jgi:hypothetical protein
MSALADSNVGVRKLTPTYDYVLGNNCGIDVPMRPEKIIPSSSIWLNDIEPC